MPVTNISTLRSGRSSSGTPITQPAVGTIPNYAILFWYAPTGKWDMANFGALDDNSGAGNGDYFRKYNDICFPKAQFVDVITGKAVALNSNPLIRCIDIDTNWKSNLGICYAPYVNTGSDKYSTRLETGGKHSPTDTKLFSRSAQPKGFGFKVGDTASTTAKYFSLTTTHSGHDHSVNTAIDVLKNISWGEYLPGLSAATGAGDYGGKSSVAVSLVIRDPSLPGGTKPITSFPKNIIVFGANLPSPDYTNNDDRGSGDNIGHRLPATGLSIPLLAKAIDVGVIGNDTFLTFRAVSNTNGTHTHGPITGVPVAASIATGQTAYVFNTGPGQTPPTTNPGAGFGAHNHNIEYHNTLILKSKELRAYITTLDETPIANGVIIGYSIGKYSGYNGSADGVTSLPSGWYFCDGSAGTPDLRGYYINANFRDSAHDVELSQTNTTTVSEIVVDPAGAHGHAGPPDTVAFFTGTDQIKTGLGTSTDIGAHGYDTVTEHIHSISPIVTFLFGGVTYKNYKQNITLPYTPPTVDIAFIQYKAP